jgi:hypothetical protein
LTYLTTAVVTLILVVVLLLRNPFFHTVLARVATKYLKSELKTEIRIDKFEIGPGKSLKLKNLLILDHQNDTLIFAGSLYVRLQHLGLKQNRFDFKSIELEKSDIRLRKNPENDEFNFQFIVDYLSKKGKTQLDSLESPEIDTTLSHYFLKTEKLLLTDCHFIFQNRRDTTLQNQINFNDIDLFVNELSTGETELADDTMKAEIDLLAFSEKSGFAVSNLSANFTFSPTMLEARNLIVCTDKNDLDLDLKFTYDSLSDFNEFIHKVRIEADLRESEMDLFDVGYFAPVLFEMDNRIRLSGKIAGTVDKFKASDFEFSFGEHTRYSGNIQMTGLPDFFETFIHLTIKEFTTTAAEVSRFKLPVPDNHLILPEIVDKFGQIEIEGKFTGFYNDFVSYGKFYTDAGEINTDLLLKLNPKHVIEYSGNIATKDLKAGKLFGIESYVNSFDLTAEIHGQGLEFKDMDLSIDGKINSLEALNTVYDEINLSGKLKDKTFKGQCSIDDQLISLDLHGIFDYSHSVPSYNFTAAIRNARLSKMNLIKRDTSMSLSSNLNINLMGDQFDNLQGIVKIDSTWYREKNESYFMQYFTLSITRDQSEYTLIRLFSDVLDASIEGKYLINDLPNHMNFFLNNYLDTLFTDLPFDKNTLKPQDFIFDVEIKNSQKLTALFFPQISLAPGTKIAGGFNSQIENLFFDASGDEADLYGKKIKKWNAEFHILKDKILLTTHADHVFFSDSLLVDSLNAEFDAARDTILFSVMWDNQSWETSNYGDLSGFFAISSKNLMRLKFNKGNIVVNDIPWKINASNYLVVDSGNLTFHNITLSSDEQELSLDGKVSDKIKDTLSIGFRKFDLSNSDRFLEPTGIDLDGFIDGSFKIVNLLNTPTFLSDITIQELSFNKEKLGEAIINSNWEPEKEVFNILAEIIYTGNVGSNKTLEAKGTYYPKKKADNFNVDITLSNYKLKTLQPFIKDFSSYVDGNASGQLKLGGSTSAPDLIGTISLMRAKLKIDYINVTYSLADKIYFDKNLIHFENITVYDSLGNQAIASGKIKHDHLSNFDLDLNFSASKLIGLNTTRSQNESFYGAALASGTVRISGPPNNLDMDINVTSEKGTNIKIPVAYGAEVTENNYIIFTDPVTDEEKEKASSSNYETDLTGMSLNLDLNITHDANIQMFMPYQMGNIQANGKGDIKMRIAPGGVFTMDGEYIINRGSLFLTLQNILNRDFDISRGSKVAWSGDPYNAQIDLKAVYKVKTTLGDFVPEQDAQTPVQVDCIIALTKSLFNPDIRFSIDFPDLKEDNKQIIYSQLDTTDQALMSQQMISLLLLNSFYHSSGTSGSVGFNTFSIVTNQLNNWLSKLSDDVNIGINYRPGTELTSDEVELALSTQLFDERVLIDGNLGVKSNSEKTGNNNNLVGEVTVDVKITRDGRFRAKAFNKSNNNYLVKNYAPYTQGIGIFYTQDFNKPGDLLRRKNQTPKIKQKPPEEQSMRNEE